MAKPGKNAEVNFGGDKVLGLNDATFTVNGELVDVSRFSGDGWRQRISNLKDATISISGFFNPADSSGQILAQTSILQGDKISNVAVLADGTNGLKCDAYVETFEISPAVEGAVGVSITLQSDGEITAEGE